jgi:hypothetical protein
VKASGDTSIAIASATGGAGKEFFSDSEEKTQRQKEGCVRLAIPGGREGGGEMAGQVEDRRRGSSIMTIIVMRVSVTALVVAIPGPS